MMKTATGTTEPKNKKFNRFSQTYDLSSKQSYRAITFRKKFVWAPRVQNEDNDTNQFSRKQSCCLTLVSQDSKKQSCDNYINYI